MQKTASFFGNQTERGEWCETKVHSCSVFAEVSSGPGSEQRSEVKLWCEMTKSSRETLRYQRGWKHSRSDVHNIFKMFQLYLSDLAPSSPPPRTILHSTESEREIRCSPSRRREKKRWSPSGSHSSLLDQYWSAGRAAAAAAERFTPAFYHDDRGVWPVQQAKSLSARQRLYHLQRQTWWPMRYADVWIIWNAVVFFSCGS